MVARKVGRNDPCPCRSGKKYKKCCGWPTVEAAATPFLSAAPTDPHRFRVQGEKAEAMVARLANKTFLKDWCFVRPTRPDGRELCDLLVAFDDTAIIWQIKDIALKDGALNEKKFAKNIRQVHGAWRHLFELRTQLTLANDRRSPEDFDPAAIKRVILFSVMMGPPPTAGRMFEEINGKLVHLMAGVDLSIVLRELDTAGDFVKYMEARQDLYERIRVPLRINGGEENLVAYYLAHERSFSEMTKHEMVEIGRDGWQNVSSHPRFLARKRADEISYAWDRLIDLAHTIRGRDPDTLEPMDVDYELLAREMAKPNRLERRALAKSLHEGYDKAMKIVGDGRGDLMRRLSPHPKCTFVFIYFAPTVAEDTRRRMLTPTMMAARSVYPNVPMVVGISVELVPRLRVEYGMFFKENWTASDETEVQAMRDRYGIFRALEQTHAYEDEFPDPNDV